MPTYSRQVIVKWDCASLVRGKDKFGNFAAAPPPARDIVLQAIAFHERARTTLQDILLQGRRTDEVNPVIWDAKLIDQTFAATLGTIEIP